jgi:hypothetical protein
VAARGRAGIATYNRRASRGRTAEVEYAPQPGLDRLLERSVASYLIIVGGETGRSAERRRPRTPVRAHHVFA